ncbi:unnamed protein product [Adineta steineri]|uniref:Uncharacterized protein n=2 Tax=Adineta steineri TaxID=433720 RepID=A0A814J3W1_9BILA|nr:unnamed protein product [Adineta steineri]CAF3527176.1 unnamed protein product [Adineta steineri]CAF4090352.1 unnamed protein product [Adineta steineri]
MSKEGRLLCPVGPLKIPTSSNLTVRLIDTMHHLNGSIKLCLLNPYRKIHKLAGCSQPLFNVHQLEAKWPGLIRMWVLFYVKYLKFGAVSIYDIDGSTEPYISGLVEKGFINYYKRWAPTESMLNVSLNGSTYCAQTMMENQCLWKHRGLSEWVMLIHSPDNFLNDFAGAPTLTAYLDSIQHNTSLTLLTTLIFGHPNITIPKQQHANNLFKVIVSRACDPLRSHRHLPVANPREVMMLFVHNAMAPFHKIPTTINNCSAKVNHYVTMFRVRSTDTSERNKTFCNDNTLYKKSRSYLSLLRDDHDAIKYNHTSEKFDIPFFVSENKTA